MAKIKMIDIGVNLTDPMFQGIYRDKKYHEADIDSVLQRAQGVGVEKIIVTGTNLAESQSALEYVRSYQQFNLYSTVGVHPTRCTDFESVNPDYYELQLKKLILENKDKVVAIGECGLDYARLQFCPREVQRKYFERQLMMAKEIGLPLFFHNRDTKGEFLQMVTEHRDKFSTGVVHSYDGTLEEALALIQLGLYIGINGCSLKTDANIQVVSKIPLNKIMIETDAPWCEIRGTSPSYPILLKSIMENPTHQPSTPYSIHKKEKFVKGSQVKFRNEPCCVYYILHILSQLHHTPIEQVAEIIYNTTEDIFFKSNLNLK
ncbi:putative deoxyribonuclease TATDN1 [Neoconidiobolus thromboides FSU 785]|nr:putative deoxyribonuclease TATDN1 [Neoconidiobolus thromboides FSU 785]